MKMDGKYVKKGAKKKKESIEVIAVHIWTLALPNDIARERETRKNRHTDECE